MPKIRRSEEYVKMLVERIIYTSLAHKSPKVDFSILKGSLLKTALMLLAKVKRITRAGHSPYVIAVSAIYAAERYLAKKENRRHILTQGFLAKITEASEYSIRENYCHFFKRLVEKD
jgi:transcription initiation factor TFIIIB Brf1 subunit/transcription initiation factor TFIIB